MCNERDPADDKNSKVEKRTEVENGQPWQRISNIKPNHIYSIRKKKGCTWNQRYQNQPNQNNVSNVWYEMYQFSTFHRYCSFLSVPFSFCCIQLYLFFLLSNFSLQLGCFELGFYSKFRILSRIKFYLTFSLDIEVVI